MRATMMEVVMRHERVAVLNATRGALQRGIDEQRRGHVRGGDLTFFVWPLFALGTCARVLWRMVKWVQPCYK